ncbi:site-specific integrase [Actinosynnema pretiosum subsp. pretiosum]|uniref:Site-specific integrase n=1 Tax=Actinosynnema pretiosum subsp. pretiosum TaxID=103721 RepID=A0AA45L5P9_9PSEU|nr:site-specific integrase [Actinosynnema pretiosum subsp. pretiosum]
MGIYDVWHLKERDENDKRIPSKSYGRGKRWRVSWDDPETGRVRTKAFHKLDDAKDFNSVVSADIVRGEYIDPDAGKITVEQFSEVWRYGRLHDPNTVNLVEKSFRNHINPVLGHLPLSGVRASHIQAWVKGRVEFLAPSTVHVMYSYIRSMMRAAVLDRRLASSPCVGISLPVIPKTDRWLPTPEQVHYIYGQIREPYRAAIYIAAGCGLRPSEVFGLERSSVDFEKREIKVVQQIKKVKGRLYVGAPKTITSVRTVEMPKIVEDALRAHFEKFPSMPIELEEDNGKKKGIRKFDLVFVTSNRNPLTSDSWGSRWRAMREALGDIPKEFGFHGLRHYYATLLIHSGASVRTVQKALGHSTPTITLNVYVHDWPEAVERTRALVDDVLGSSSGAPVRAGGGEVMVQDAA